MTVKELRKRIDLHCRAQHGLEDSRVVIPVTSPDAAIGGTPAVDVKDIGGGIDWNAGRLFVYPDEQLFVGLDKLKAKAQLLDRVREIIYMVQFDTTRQKNGNAIMLIREAFEDAEMPISDAP